LRTVTASNGKELGINVGLSVLRIGVGLSLLLIFGLPKIYDAWGYIRTGHWPFVDFNRKSGLPFPIAAALLQTVNESVGAFLVACGFLSRYASASLALGFVVATICSLRAGEAAWLTAAYFALIFSTLLLTGPGKFALDAVIESRRGLRLQEKE
jgi:uncharacterized membrane protein YphA (DoxX/SURF4 family)